MVLAGKGILSSYSFEEQVRILDNYYKALKNVFPQFFEDQESVFFKTTGFGALIRVLPAVFSYVLKEKKGFTVADATDVLNKVKTFDFNAWKRIGTGNAAEIQASEDIRSELEQMFKETTGDSTKIRL